MRHFREDVGGGGRDQEEVGFVGEANVRRLPTFFFVVEIGDDGAAGKGFEREGGDELLRVRGEDDVDFDARFGEAAGEVGGFVSGDGTGDAQDDVAGFSHNSAVASGRGAFFQR